MPKHTMRTIDFLLYEEQNYRCYYCDCDLLAYINNGGNLEIDHKIPKSAGGEDIKTNLVLVCHWCNKAKRDKSVAEFLKYLQPYRDGILTQKEDSVSYHIMEKLRIKLGFDRFSLGEGQEGAEFFKLIASEIDRVRK